MEKNYYSGPKVKPIKALHAAWDLASTIISPPYDVVSTSEAKRLVIGKPDHFLRVSRPEIEFPEQVNPYSKEVYDRGHQNFQRLLNEGKILIDSYESYYIWQMVFRGNISTGIVAGISVEAYNLGIIKKHELTRAEKEEDRVRHISALGAHTGPVMLICREDEILFDIVTEVKGARPSCIVKDSSGVEHSIWCVSDETTTKGISNAFSRVSNLYIADGHHRSAAASVVAKNKPDQYFLGVVLPASELRIFPYYRTVRDLNGHNLDSFLSLIRTKFKISPREKAVEPKATKQIGLYINHSWFELILRDSDELGARTEGMLDVDILSSFILQPILGINDLRKDKRVDFVGGIRGLSLLESIVDSGVMACAFSLYPTNVDHLMAVADADGIMPPKSTWFEPKLVDGLISMRTE